MIFCSLIFFLVFGLSEHSSVDNGGVSIAGGGSVAVAVGGGDR